MRRRTRAGVEVSASSQTHQCMKEVPLAHCVRGGMTHRTQGESGKRWVPGTPAPSGGKPGRKRRHPAAAMSRRDSSSVGNGCGAGFPKPLRGWTGCISAYRVYLRVFVRRNSAGFCGILRDQRAICEGGGHSGLL